MERKEIAKILRENGSNCAQAVVVPFSVVLGSDPVHTFKMAEALGFGLGDGDGMCGALTGAAMMVGMKKSDGDIDNPGTKKMTYNTISLLKKEFTEKMGGNTCRKLKNDGKCEKCVALACELLDKYLLGIYPDGERPDIKVIRNEHAKF
ncbi:MAG: C-GCAxxG-C-C family protein [Clostridia bacterium]|nr:C-GCAxxG-C-C family protein [Clostridia bacterium]